VQVGRLCRLALNDECARDPVIGASRSARLEGDPMTTKSPRKTNEKKPASKSLKEKREDKKSKRETRGRGL
jgi:hypothetical protein